MNFLIVIDYRRAVWGWFDGDQSVVVFGFSRPGTELVIGFSNQGNCKYKVWCNMCMRVGILAIAQVVILEKSRPSSCGPTCKRYVSHLCINLWIITLVHVEID